MKRKGKIIDHSDIMKCWTCNGKGHVHVIGTNTDKIIKCKSCNGTGKFRESHYYIIDNKNKIAIDSDTVS